MAKAQDCVRLFGIVLLIAICAHSLAQTKTPAVPVIPFTVVPLIGCDSDGQMGPVRPPKAKTKRVRIAKESAQKLVFYASSQGLGVLAPPGWHCFGTYGSNGDTLYVSPEPLDAEVVLSGDWKGLHGPAIQIGRQYGDTSGRFAVARMIARVFPERKSFVNAVIKEGIEPASSFPFGPYPADKLVRKGTRVVEYETPAHTEGLGTHSRLQKGKTPISGFVQLTGEAPDLFQVAVRLPKEMSELVPVIIQEIEGRSTKH